MLNLFKSHISE